MASFACPNCGNLDIVRRGFRKRKNDVKQRFRCNNCRSTFVEPDGFERMRHTKEVIARAVHMHQDGLSLFKTQIQLWQHDAVSVTRKTINDWTKKYSVFLKSAARKREAKTQRKAAL